MSNPIKLKFGCQGRFKLAARHAVTGEVRQLTDWFDNNITNYGLNRMATAAFMIACQVGTGNTAPANTDTALATYVAGTTTILSTTKGGSGSSPYYYFCRHVFQFAAGVAEGNIAEVGISHQSATGNLTVRTLVVDGGGSPTTVAVGSEELLEVTYEFRNYAMETDVTGTTSIGGVSTGFTMRGRDLDNVTTSSAGDQISSQPTTITVNAYAGGATLGSITESITGSLVNIFGSSISYETYVSDSHELTFTFSCPTTAGNHGSGIGAFLFLSAFGWYQIAFAPAIMKTSLHRLDLTFTISWDRYVAP